MNQGSSSAMLREEEEYLGRRIRIMERRRDLATVEGWGEQGEELRVVKLGARERAKQSSPLPALFPPHPPPSLLPLAVALALALAVALALALAVALAVAPPPRYLLLLLLVHHRLSIAFLSHPLLLNSSTSSSPSSFLRHASPPPDCLDSNLAWFCIHAPCLVLILLPSFSPSSSIPLFPQTLGSTKPIQSTRHTRSPIESLISSTNANQLSALDIVGGSTCRPFPLPYTDPPSFEVTLLPLEDDAVARWYLE
ncbi:hypothetical protein CTAM01_07801 [Colletotrichum tamarilloi]|uniref:Uncharacterized protein n=1 Tax=Colletotrichum tamarilloi TaxID=1209934 RepID=A0ABQ9R816_9PEZI|nr:uncharacterized protein CTAM01_07801 [Colletotrichum tamarilloi]KAK1497531.1 hypothetical protein CTAM01_07801 [Colletotrichum tamarilloi]